MYICLCNGIKDKDVQALAARCGGCTVSQAFQQLGCKPVCGLCVPLMRECVEPAGNEAAA